MRYDFTILGIAQDGGFPQFGCNLNCCQNIPIHTNFISSAAIIDNKLKEYWLIDVTPEFRYQFNLIKHKVNSIIPKGIFITHAHSGHYTGLIEFGKEVLNSKSIPVHVMPKMLEYLKSDNPWKNLINQENLHLIKMNNAENIIIDRDINITPFLVNHRQEIAETVGFRIIGPNIKIIYLPDIDNWDEIALQNMVQKNDYLFIDGTFYNHNELQHRNIENIPHPSIEKTIELLNAMNTKDKNKVHFIHLNHTNNAIKKNSRIYKEIYSKKFKISSEGMKIYL